MSELRALTPVRAIMDGEGRVRAVEYECKPAVGQAVIGLSLRRDVDAVTVEPVLDADGRFLHNRLFVRLPPPADGVPPGLLPVYGR